MLAILIATIGFVSLVANDFLQICRLAGKEEIVEKIWRNLFPKSEYDRDKVFGQISQDFWRIFAVALLFSKGLLYNKVILFLALIDFVIVCIEAIKISKK